MKTFHYKNSTKHKRRQKCRELGTKYTIRPMENKQQNDRSNYFKYKWIKVSKDRAWLNRLKNDNNNISQLYIIYKRLTLDPKAPIE